MNKELQPTQDTLFATIADNITAAIRRSMLQHFDVFTHLLSNIIWQSPVELGLKLIQEVAPNEWEMISEQADDTIEIRREKEKYRKGVISITNRLIGSLRARPGILQIMTTRLLVQETLIYGLPSTDQDRVIAAELMLGYRNWKRLLSTVATHNILNDERKLADRPCSYIDEHGRYTHALTVFGHIDPIDSIPELPIVHTHVVQSGKIGSIPVMVSMEISKLLFDESTLVRHDNTLPSSKSENDSRISLVDHLGPIRTYRKRSIGNDRQKPEPELEWMPYGA